MGSLYDNFMLYYASCGLAYIVVVIVGGKAAAVPIVSYTLFYYVLLCYIVLCYTLVGMVFATLTWRAAEKYGNIKAGDKEMRKPNLGTIVQKTTNEGVIPKDTQGEVVGLNEYIFVVKYEKYGCFRYKHCYLKYFVRLAG